jgi:hypothetical protein
VRDYLGGAWYSTCPSVITPELHSDAGQSVNGLLFGEVVRGCLQCVPNILGCNAVGGIFIGIIRTAQTCVAVMNLVMGTHRIR